MHPLAFEGIEVGRQGRHQCLALAGDHLGDRSGVKHHAADQLDVIVTHAEEPLASRAADGESLDQQVIDRFARLQSSLELKRLGPQFGVGHRLVAGLEGVDRLDLRLQPLQVAGIRRAEQPGDEPFDAAGESRRKVADGVPDTFQLFHGGGVGGAKWLRYGRPTSRFRQLPAEGRTCWQRGPFATGFLRTL